MFKYFFIVLLSFNILSSDDDIVKTSELELFLFKIGFESLLKDVDITKDKSTLNEQEIKTINEKIELIMSELYKDKRVLLNDSEKSEVAKSIDSKELENLKNEISFLKKEILELKNKKQIKAQIITEEKPINAKTIEIKKKKIVKVQKKEEAKFIKKKTEIKSNEMKMRVATPLLAVYITASTEAEVVKKIKHNTIIEVENCVNGWCKLSNGQYFVRRYLIKPWKK